MKITGKTIGTRIRQTRGTDSQEIAAKKTKVSISAIRNYERDTRVPTLEIIDKIAKTYSISPTIIAYGDEIDLKGDQKLKQIINKILMFGEKEKEALETMIDALEILCIVRKQDKK